MARERDEQPADRAPIVQGDVAVVRSAILSHYAALATSMGVNVIDMLDRSGVDRRCLASPDLLVPIERAARLVALTAAAAHSDTFGIQLTLGRGTPDLGPLNLLLREEPDLRSALRSLQGFFHVHSNGISFALEEADDLTLLRVGVQSVTAAPQATEMAVCGFLQTLCWLTGEASDAFSVCFAHPGPRDVSRHRALLGCAVLFDSDVDGVLVSTATLSRPIPQATPALRRHAEDYVRALSETRPDRFEQKVRRLIVSLLPSGRCSAQAVAAQFGIERTTMARRLARSGTSFERILLDVRKAAAVQACRSDLRLKLIAERLGYADLSSFSRWFARTFGCSPTEWRTRDAQAEVRAQSAIR